MNQILTRVSPFYHNKSLRRIFQIVWISVISLFILLAIGSHWDVISRIEWNSERLSLIGLAVAATLCRRLAGGFLWAWIVQLISKSKSITFRQSLKVYFVSNLATYIPGTYWFIPGRIVMNTKHGVNALQTGASTLLEQFLIILSGALFGLSAVNLIAEQLHFQVASFWWIVMVIIIGLIAIHPRSIQRIINLMARILKTEQVSIRLHYGTALLLLMWSCTIWTMSAFSLWFLTKAFIPEIPFTQVGIFGAIFAISWLIGFFTPFAPSGIGVREGVMGIAFVAIGIPLEITVLLAALSRVLIILEDVFWGPIGMFVL